MERPPVCSNVVELLESLACTSRVEHWGVLAGRGSTPSTLVVAPGGVRVVDATSLLVFIAPLAASLTLEPVALVHTHPLGNRPSLLDELVADAWRLPMLLASCGRVSWSDGGPVERLGYACGIVWLPYNPVYEPLTPGA